MTLKLAITAEFPEEDTGYIEEGFEYCLNDGNNLVSYPCDSTVPIADAIPDSDLFLTTIVGEGVAAILIDGEWIGSLTGFNPGDGYWLQSTSEICFEYECSE